MADPDTTKAVREFLADLPPPATILCLPDLPSLDPQPLLVLITLTHAWCRDGLVRLLGVMEAEPPDWSAVLDGSGDLLRGRLGTVDGFADLFEQTGDAEAVEYLLILRYVLGALGKEFTRRTARGPARKVSQEQDALDDQARPLKAQGVPAQLRPLARALRVGKSFGSDVENTAEDALGRALAALARKFPPWEDAVGELVLASPFRQLRPEVVSGWEDALCADVESRLKQARERLFLPYLMDWPLPLLIVHGGESDTRRRGRAKKRGGAGTGPPRTVLCPQCQRGTGVPPFQCSVCGIGVTLDTGDSTVSEKVPSEFWQSEAPPDAAAIQTVALEEIERRHGSKTRRLVEALMEGKSKTEIAEAEDMDRKALNAELRKIQPWFRRRFR